jgi:hypothetical protein
MEGCTALRFETATLHSPVVELIALKKVKIFLEEILPVLFETTCNSMFSKGRKRAENTKQGRL